MEFALWAGVAIVVIHLAVRIAGLLAVRRLRLRAPRLAAADETEVPADLRTVLAEARESLAPFGFAPAGWAVATSADAGDDRPQWLALAVSGDGVWLLLGPSSNPEHGLPWQTALLSPIAGGRWLLTAPTIRHQYFGAIPATEFTAVPSGPIDPSPLAALEQHRRALAGHAPGEAPASGADLVARLDAAWSRYPADLIDAGHAVAAGDDRVRPTLGAAWRTVSALQRGAGALARGLAAQTRAGQSPAVPAAVEADAVLRQEARRDAGGGDRLAGLVMVAGAAVFLVASGAQAAAWWHGAIILAVLAFHEAGHLAAMRLFGYRDTAIFFLPFLGAITTGRKRDATVAQQALIALAGPVPGIVAGTALLLAGAEGEVAHFTAVMLLVLNLFNLLPLMPLDGGQILHRLLLARLPWIDLAMRILAVAGLGLVGIGEPLLLGLAVVLALGLPGQWREAGFARACLRDPALRGLDHPALLAALAARIVAAPALARTACAARWHALRTTAERIARRGPGALGTIGLLAAWLGALVLPLLVLVIAALVRDQGAGAG